MLSKTMAVMEDLAHRSLSGESVQDPSSWVKVEMVSIQQMLSEDEVCVRSGGGASRWKRGLYRSANA